MKIDELLKYMKFGHSGGLNASREALDQLERQQAYLQNLQAEVALSRLAHDNWLMSKATEFDSTEILPQIAPYHEDSGSEKKSEGKLSSLKVSELTLEDSDIEISEPKQVSRSSRKKRKSKAQSE